MSFSVRLRVAGTLVDLARVLRVLKRHRSPKPEVCMRIEEGREVTVLVATVASEKRSRRLSTALARVPAVLDAVALG
jgi:hypothetical protein